jgi:hypothetical protein
MVFAKKTVVDQDHGVKLAVVFHNSACEAVPHPDIDDAIFPTMIDIPPPSPCRLSGMKRQLSRD